MACSCRSGAQSEAARSRTVESSALEQSLLAAVNKLRSDPDSFAGLIDSRRPYYRDRLLQLPLHPAIQTQEGVRAVDDAVAALDDTEPMPQLQYSAALRTAARSHGSELGRTGKISHEGNDGSSPRDRMSRFASIEGSTGEVISFGLDDPEEMVIEFVIDDGVASRAHRAILLGTAYRYAAAACGPHSYYKLICVVDLAEQVRPKTAR